MTPSNTPASVAGTKTEAQRKAEEESREPSVSEPGGFNNDPDDSTNPNEAIERHRQKLRP